MATICVACNTKNIGMINLLCHPNGIDKMFTFVSNLPEIKIDHYLCIPCYDDLKIAYNFKRKCHQSQFFRENHFDSRIIIESTNLSTNYEETILENKISGAIEHKEEINEENPLIISSNDPDSQSSPINCKDFIDTFDSQNDSNHSNADKESTIEENLNDNISQMVDVRNDITITNLFNCLSCGKSFTRSGNFRRHQRTIHMIGYKKTSKIGRNKHKRGPSPKLSENDVFAMLKETQCEYCFVNFETEESMKLHEEVHKSEEKPYKCTFEKCASQFKERFGLRKHLETHSNVKRFKCKFCDQRFHQIGNARSHERYHTGEKPYLCPHCGKAFAESGNLKAHIRFHTGERPYACPQCPKRFTTHYSHKIHIRSHTQERPYLCSDCGKSFKSSGKLLVHRRIHSGHRPYKCDVCPAAFVDNSGLKRHSKIH